MNPLILNRNFQHPTDGWYQIEAKGTHPNRAAGVVQVIDDAATTSIVNRFNADAAASKLRHGAEMLIDHEHFSDQPDQETRAYGWLQELQNRTDGIYGRIRWTATGQAAVDGGDYRFFSTEYDAANLQAVEPAIGNRQSAIKAVRPLALAGLTLTNMNNNRGQKPITNRGSSLILNSESDSEDGVWRTINGRAVFIADGESVEEAMKDSSKQAAYASRKADTDQTSESHAVAAQSHHQAAKDSEARGDIKSASDHLDKAAEHRIKSGDVARRRSDSVKILRANERRGIENRATHFPAACASGANQNHKTERTNTMKSIATKLGLAPEASEDAILGEVTKLQNRLTSLEPLATENTTLKNRNTELETEQCDVLLDLFQVKEVKARETLKPILGTLKNRADRVTVLTNLGHKPADPKKPAALRILNRGESPVAPQGEITAGSEQELAQQAEVEIQAYKLTNRCSYSDARNMVRTQKPALFGLTK
jgi:hypothetical protein